MEFGVFRVTFYWELTACSVSIVTELAGERFYKALGVRYAQFVKGRRGISPLIIISIG
ncbi:MAG: hypothetical protein V8S95_11765 [Odoribacter sp.]